MRPLSEDEVRDLTARLTDELQDYVRFRVGQPVLDGPATITELAVGKHLLVLGDAACEALLAVPQGASLTITGSLVAQDIIVDGNVIVLGELTARDVFGDSRCDRVFRCSGNARVRCLIEKGHDFGFEGDLAAELVASITNVVRIRGAKQIAHSFLGGMSDDERRTRFAPALFDAEGTLRGELIEERLRAGQPLLATPASNIR